MRYIALVDGERWGVRSGGAWICPVAPRPAPRRMKRCATPFEAVRLWVEDAIDDGEALPPPRSGRGATGRALRLPPHWPQAPSSA